MLSKIFLTFFKKIKTILIFAYSYSQNKRNKEEKSSVSESNAKSQYTKNYNYLFLRSNTMKKLFITAALIATSLCLFSCSSDAEEKLSLSPDTSLQDELIEEILDHADNSHEEEEIEIAEKNLFESDRLSVYASQFGDELKKIHKSYNGQLYIETEDGFYHASDESLSENFLDSEDIESWGFFEVGGFWYLDGAGYYHFGDLIAHDIKGKIIYAEVESDSLSVYSMDDEGHVYRSRFESTGKKDIDNELIYFEEREQNGYSFTDLGTYDKVESLRVLPVKSSYFVAPELLITVNGNTYVTKLYPIIQSSISLITSSALNEDGSANFIDYYNYSTVYSKDKINDKLFYTYEGEEYTLNLPDGHTLDEITYFNRGICDMMTFDNGDVYYWDGEASILGETPEKDEELSAIGNDIVEVLYCSTTYRILMSDGTVYTLDDPSGSYLY